MAFCSGHVNIVKALLGQSADVNAVSQLKTTPLFFAARCKDAHFRAEVFDMLVKAGADEGAKGLEGKTPRELLMIAQTKGLGDDDAVWHPPIGAEASLSGAEPKLLESVYVDENGRTMKKVVDVSKAAWDAMGRRILPTTIERDGKEERREKRKEEKRDKKFLEAEAKYVLETGDKHGLAGFIKVGHKAVEASSVETETFLVRELVRMGFDKDAGRFAGN